MAGCLLTHCTAVQLNLFRGRGGALEPPNNWRCRAVTPCAREKNRMLPRSAHAVAGGGRKEGDAKTSLRSKRKCWNNNSTKTFASFSVFDTPVLMRTDSNLGPFSVLIKGTVVPTLIKTKNSLTGCAFHAPVNGAEVTWVAESIQIQGTPRSVSPGGGAPEGGAGTIPAAGTSFFFLRASLGLLIQILFPHRFFL